MPILAWKHILNSTHNTLPGFNMRQACIQLKSILFRLLPAMSYPRQDFLCDTTVTAESSRDIRATHFYCGPDWHTDRRGDPLSLLQGLPAQVRPSPVKPGLQLQPKLPLLSVQKPLTLSQLWTPVAHSSISEEKETVALISSSPIEWNMLLLSFSSMVTLILKLSQIRKLVKYFWHTQVTTRLLHGCPYIDSLHLQCITLLHTTPLSEAHTHHGNPIHDTTLSTSLAWVTWFRCKVNLTSWPTKEARCYSVHAAHSKCSHSTGLAEVPIISTY